MVGNVDRAIILVVSPFKRTYERPNLVQVEDSRGGEYKQASFSMEALKEPHRRILFIHPEICVDDSSFISLLKSPIYQKRVKCVVRNPSDQGMV